MRKKTLGIILAAGRSSRLYPATLVTTKQVLPIYDKPLIYYPLTTLMLAGISDFVMITNPKERIIFEDLFRDHRDLLGINITFATQAAPNGIADAFNVAQHAMFSKLSEYDNFALILGDNIFYGATMTGAIKKAIDADCASVFATRVSDPERFGVVDIDSKGNALSLEEKPINPKSNYAVTGLYVYPANVFEHVYRLLPSHRGELEITDLNKMYLQENNLQVQKLARGVVWFDTGTPDSMLESSTMIQTLQRHQQIMIGSPHEAAYINGWITPERLKETAELCHKTAYGQYLMSVL